MKLAKKITPLILLLSIFFLPFFVRATDFTSPGFIIRDPVIKLGAGFSTSSGFQLWSSIGQEVIGISSGTTFILQSGFLYFPLPTTTTAQPVNLPPPSAGGGLPPSLLKKIVLSSDFNNDGHVDLIDLSIILYFYGQNGRKIARYDLNGDGTVNFIDVSILFYYWTG
ncbi:MAG: dockerin type I domain-containing protein [Patescibacteria group bacterium]